MIKNPYNNPLPFAKAKPLSTTVVVVPVLPSDFPDDIQMGGDAQACALFRVISVGPRVRTVQAGQYVIPSSAGIDILVSDGSYMCMDVRDIRLVFDESDLV